MNFCLVLIPAPHVLEHDLQLLHAPHWQSTGQQPVEHVRDSDGDPIQALPPHSSRLI